MIPAADAISLKSCCFIGQENVELRPLPFLNTNGTAFALGYLL